MSYPRPNPLHLRPCRRCSHPYLETEMVSVARLTNNPTKSRSGWVCTPCADEVRGGKVLGLLR